MGKNYALSVRFFGLVRPVRLGRTTNGLVRSESEVRGKSAFKVRTKSGPGRTAKWPVLLIPNVGTPANFHTNEKLCRTALASDIHILKPADAKEAENWKECR